MRTPATRKLRRPPVKEVSLHMSVAAFIRRAWPEHLPWSHFPAGERRDAKTGAKLKSMGLAAGWPDFVFLLPKGQVGFIELKIPGGALSDAQIEFRDRAMALGAGHAVCRSMEEVEAVLDRWAAAFGLELRCHLLTTRRAA